LPRLSSNRSFSGLTIICFIFGWTILQYPIEAYSSTNKIDGIRALVGSSDSVAISDPHGKIIFEKNSDKKLVPASALKVLTALVALHNLKDDFRFSTDFYLDDKSNLTIKGYGDPLLVSENDEQITESLGNQLSSVNDIVLDNSYFESPIVVPGVSASSHEPYDAPNGAICVNFNTVSFICKNGECVSGESQTPFLIFIRQHIENSGLESGRIPLSKSNDQAVFYAGHLFLFFLQNRGMNITGNLRLGKVNEDTDRLIFHYVSKFQLTEIISKLLAHSNNFIANQLLITTGAYVYGPPGSLEKGLRAIKAYSDSVLGIPDISVSEGAGISRENRLSSRMFLKILNKFESYAGLMRHQGNQYYKTGTLDGVHTRVGYMTSKQKGTYRFVVMVNTPGKTTEAIMAKIKQLID